jgi:hypothetical protein
VQWEEKNKKLERYVSTAYRIWLGKKLIYPSPQFLLSQRVLNKQAYIMLADQLTVTPHTVSSQKDYKVEH